MDFVIHRRLSHIVASFVFAAGLFAPSLALAWDRLGHALIASLAERQLSPQARAQIALLLPDQPEEDQPEEPRLPSIASWADEIRGEPKYRETSPLHYVNFVGVCRFDPHRDCPDGKCVIAAIDRYAKVLGNTGEPLAERIEALKFLVHFVGDVHQPLHAGHRSDLGGNRFQVNVLGKGTNLHRIWDHSVLASAGLPFTQYHDLLSQTPLPPSGTLDPAQWAESACRLTDRQGFYPKRPGKLPGDYLKTQRPLAEAQVRLAASRLAALLERELGTAPVLEP